MAWSSAGPTLSYYRFSLSRAVPACQWTPAPSTSCGRRADGYVANAPTRLAVQAEGTRIRCQVDERLVCDLEDGDPAAPASDAVGLYTWDSATAAFDEVRARPWPGNALAPARGHLAELEVSRPLFTDAFDDLGAFEVQFLDSGSPSGGGSAGSGTATITAPRSGRVVGALAGNSEAGDYLVECNAHPAGRGRFGLVARHGGPDSYLSLELEPGVGRKLLARLGGSGIIVPVRVLWQDEGLVEVGRDYALALRCEGDTVTVSVDGEEHTATLPGSLPARGRFGLFSAVPAPGCAFTDLVVRSAPRAVVHHWSFTTSRYLGLPDLLDGFVGESWPLPEAAPAPAVLAGEAATAAATLAERLLARDGARAALAAAVDAGDAVELEELREVARTAADGLEPGFR